jgi:hypothetical protein
LRQSKDGDATVVVWIEAKRVAKIEIESYQAALLFTAYRDYFRVGTLTEILIENRRDIMAGRG